MWLFFVATFITYVIFFLIPSDPGRLRAFGFTASPVQAAKIKSELHLDVPAYQQYWIFVWNMIRHASLGYSFENKVRAFLTQNPVWPDLTDRLAVTVSLAIGAAILWAVSGVAVGLLSALRKGSIFDRSAMAIALAGVSLPIFFTGLLSLSIFSYNLGWTAPGGSYVPITQNPAQWAHDLLLPWITFMFFFAAFYVRLIRASMLDVVHEDYVRTAVAKGASARRVVFHHVLRNSMLPVVTFLGTNIAYALGTVHDTATV